MKNISLIFSIHHPVQLKKYRFLDIGNDNYYYDDSENERIIANAAEVYYLPVNKILTILLKESYGRFKVAFSISGTAIDLFTLYAPEVIKSLQEMASTGYVEFLGETYAHSLVSLKDTDEFKRQVEAHYRKMEELFGERPKVFRNTGLIYSDAIGEMAAEAGFKAVITEGATHILRWRSPNYLYSHSIIPDLKLLFNHHALSENLAFRFSKPALTEWSSDEKNYLTILKRIPEQESVINLNFDYRAIFGQQVKSSTTLNFLQSFPRKILETTGCGFMNPSEMISSIESVAQLSIPDTISAAPYEKGVLSYLGNDLQREAFKKLYEVKERIDQSPDHSLLKDWIYLQTSDHFRCMSSEQYPDTETEIIENPYDNFYEAFMNYMNVLNDFTLRANRSLAILQTDFAAKKLYGRMAM